MLARALHQCSQLFLSRLFPSFFHASQFQHVFSPPFLGANFYYTALRNTASVTHSLPLTHLLVCLSVLMEPAPMSLSSLIWYKPVSDFSDTTLCCFFTDCFSSSFSLRLLSFHVFGHPVALSSLTDDSLFILLQSPTISFNLLFSSLWGGLTRVPKVASGTVNYPEVVDFRLPLRDT